MATIEERLEALEKRAPIRGPAGDISAAVRNANQAVADAEARIRVVADEALAKVQAKADELANLARKLRSEVEETKQYLDERIYNTVDATLVKTLQEYRLLDANCTPTHWSK
jgi:DNA repair ATPase RecN